MNLPRRSTETQQTDVNFSASMKNKFPVNSSNRKMTFSIHSSSFEICSMLLPIRFRWWWISEQYCRTSHLSITVDEIIQVKHKFSPSFPHLREDAKCFIGVSDWRAIRPSSEMRTKQRKTISNLILHSVERGKSSLPWILWDFPKLQTSTLTKRKIQMRVMT